VATPPLACCCAVAVAVVTGHSCMHNWTPHPSLIPGFGQYEMLNRFHPSHHLYDHPCFLCSPIAVEGLRCKRPIQCLASSKILTPHRPARVYPAAFGAEGGHTNWVERGVGGQYFGRRQILLCTLLYIRKYFVAIAKECPGRANRFLLLGTSIAMVSDDFTLHNTLIFMHS
jgi:hypothetical protein